MFSAVFEAHIAAICFKHGRKHCKTRDNLNFDLENSGSNFQFYRNLQRFLPFFLAHPGPKSQQPMRVTSGRSGSNFQFYRNLQCFLPFLEPIQAASPGRKSRSLRNLQCFLSFLKQIQVARSSWIYLPPDFPKMGNVSMSVSIKFLTFPGG